MKRAAVLLLILFWSRVPVYGEIQPGQWREDLHVLASQLVALHPNAFHSVSRNEFEAAVSKLNDRIPGLSREEIIVGFMRIVAMIGDGHTSLSPLYDPSIGFHYYPLALYPYSDGLYVQRAPSDFSDVVGARLVAIEDTSAEDALKKIGEIISHDNEMGMKSLAPAYLVIPEILKALGMIQDRESARFVFELNGKQFMKTLHPAGLIPPLYHNLMLEKVEWTDARKGPAPLFLSNRSDAYWYKFLADSGTLYVQYNLVRNQDGETIEAFCDRVFRFVEENPVKKFVLDVRFNRGGNNYFNKPVILGLIQSRKINQKGKLFVIIGRDTFSAAQNLVNEIEKYTNVIFVGEPTGENVNFYGDHDPIVLPNSKVTAMVSRLWWQNMDPRDHRKWTSPEMKTEMSSSDYKNGNDPAMNAILHCNYQPVAEVVMPALEKRDFVLLRNQLAAFRDDSSHHCVNLEKEMNTLGYHFLGHNDVEGAIEMFKLNVEQFPASWNAYDSLGEAYLKKGETELALRNYKKSLELNPENATARETLKHLEGSR